MDDILFEAMQDELTQKLAAPLRKALKGLPVTSIFPKLATAGYGAPPHEYEQMTREKWKQTVKDLPVAIVGTGAGYALGRTAAEWVVPHVFSTPQSQQVLKNYLPAAAAVAGGAGSMLLSAQRRMLRERREAASKPITTDHSPKVAGSPAPAVAQAGLKDPWRTDHRYRAP